MMTSTPDEISPAPLPPRRRAVRASLAAILVGVVGAGAALVIGLLTFGVQATVEPRHLPLAVGSAEAGGSPALAPIIAQLTARGGDAVTWHTVDSRAEAERLLDRKEVYGALLLTPGPSGVQAIVLLSGALNPSATQVAQPVLTQVAQSVTAAARAQAAAARSHGAAPIASPAAPAGPDVQVVTIHPTSAAGRTLPLAASALLWLATLATSVLAAVAAPRIAGRPLGRLARMLAAACGAVLATAVVLGLSRGWDASLAFSGDAVGFLTLVGVAFGLLQAALLRWLGLPGVAVLGLLYLTAPAVAGLVPELLNPVYKAALWSWTPFRFSTEALRSLLLLGPDAPDIQPAIWVFTGIAIAGLALLVAPIPRRRPSADVAGGALKTVSG